MEIIRAGSQGEIINSLPAFAKCTPVWLVQPVVHSFAPIQHLLPSASVDHDTVDRQVGTEVAVTFQFKDAGLDEGRLEVRYAFSSDSPFQQFVSPFIGVFRKEDSPVVPDCRTQVGGTCLRDMPVVISPNCQ